MNDVYTNIVRLQFIENQSLALKTYFTLVRFNIHKYCLQYYHPIC